MTRFWELDAARGIAVAMMAVFHFMWDLNYFGFINVGLYSGFWGLFQKAIAGSFLFLAGISIVLSMNSRKEGFAMHALKRGLAVFGMGLAITAFTIIFFRDEFIYFGILHLIGLSIILSVPFVKRKNLSLAAGIAIIALPVLFSIGAIGPSWLSWLGVSETGATLDYSPVIPGFGIVLLGIWAGSILYKNGKRTFELKEFELKGPDNIFSEFSGSAPIKALLFSGRNALAIYFLHQPILFSVVWAATLIH